MTRLQDPLQKLPPHDAWHTLLDAVLLRALPPGARRVLRSDDQRFVAVLLEDWRTLLLDATRRRWRLEPGYSPSAFNGHVLELEGDDSRFHPFPPYSDIEHIDLDMLDDADWHACPVARNALGLPVKAAG